MCARGGGRCAVPQVGGGRRLALLADPKGCHPARPAGKDPRPSRRAWLHLHPGGQPCARGSNAEKHRTTLLSPHAGSLVASLAHDENRKIGAHLPFGREREQVQVDGTVLNGTTRFLGHVVVHRQVPRSRPDEAAQTSAHRRGVEGWRACTQERDKQASISLPDQSQRGGSCRPFPKISQPEGPGERTAAQMSQPLAAGSASQDAVLSTWHHPACFQLDRASRQEKRKGGQASKDGMGMGMEREVFVIHGPAQRACRHPSLPPSHPPLPFASTNRTEPFRQSLLVAGAPLICLLVGRGRLPNGTKEPGRRARNPTRAFWRLGAESQESF